MKKKYRKRPMSSLEEEFDWESYQRIKETLEELAREGLLVDSGRKRRSKLSGRYETVWTLSPEGERVFRNLDMEECRAPLDLLH
jgi:hypothetical protein